MNISEQLDHLTGELLDAVRYDPARVPALVERRATLIAAVRFMDPVAFSSEDATLLAHAAGQGREIVRLITDLRRTAAAGSLLFGRLRCVLDSTPASTLSVSL
jgi:hypothetical protein